MTTLTKRVARQICTSPDCCGGECSDHVDRAEAALLEMLEALREPSMAVRTAGIDGCPMLWRVNPPVNPARCTLDTDQVAELFRAMLDAFAREHDLDPPPVQEQQP